MKWLLIYFPLSIDCDFDDPRSEEEEDNLWNVRFWETAATLSLSLLIIISYKNRTKKLTLASLIILSLSPIT